MGSINIHLAIGQKYLEKNKNIDKKEFLKGIIEVDLTDNKKKTHYTGFNNKNNLLLWAKERVLLNKFLEKENIESDYQKGIFIHLITDYLFFNKLLDENYLKNISYDIFVQDLYYSYDILDEYLEKKYKIDYMEFKEKIEENKKKYKSTNKIIQEVGKNILFLKDLEDFIEYVANINLDKYKNKIIYNGKNIFP